MIVFDIKGLHLQLVKEKFRPLQKIHEAKMAADAWNCVC